MKTPTWTTTPPFGHRKFILDNYFASGHSNGRALSAPDGTSGKGASDGSGHGPNSGLGQGNGQGNSNGQTYANRGRGAGEACNDGYA